MSITIGSTQATGRNIKVQAITTAAGIALAIAAGVALVPASNSSKSATPAPITSAIGSMPVPERQVFYYLVGSQEEAAALEAAFSSERAAYGDQATSEFSTIVVDTPEAESIVSVMVQDEKQFGDTMRVVDLRQPPVSPNAANTDTRSVSEADANIMASVVSTELANLSSGIAVVASSREAIESNVMASVISTERANFGAGAPVAATQVVYYVTASEIEAAIWRGMLSGETYVQETPVELQVMVVDAPEKELLLEDTARQMGQKGVNFQMVDLRNR